MKKGFTLPELLITLAVVGVVSALALPAISNLMPNQDKVMFMKAYNTVTQFAQEIATNPNYYKSERRINPTTGKFEYSCLGLGCINYPPTVPGLDNDSYTGSAKFKNIFANYLDTEVENYDYIFSENGLNYKIFQPTVLSEDHKNSKHVIYILLDPDAEIKLFDPTTNKNPKVFCIKIDDYGNVYEVDAMAKAFLMSPTKTNDKKSDLKCAEKIYNKYNSNNIVLNTYEDLCK